MRRPSPRREPPGKLSREAAFVLWLETAREDIVLAASPATLAQRHSLDPRLVETKLLARQDVIRRAQSSSI